MTTAKETSEQPSLPGMVRAEVRATRPTTPPSELAAEQPVAQVLVGVPLAHLDQTFDYSVPKSMDADAVAGARVRVRFAGQEVGGYIVSRSEASAHPGRLQPLRRVVSPEPVLSPEIAELSRQVAARYCGTQADVLRLAIPPRHARTEKQVIDRPRLPEVMPESQTVTHYPGAAAALQALERGEQQRIVWTIAPGDNWATLLAQTVIATAHSGQGVLVCVPDGAAVSQLAVALKQRLGADSFVELHAEIGPAARYRAFLALSRGKVRIAIGTRSAAFAPVAQLGLIAIWDDGDDLYAEPRAPYPHTREVLLLRAQAVGASFIAAAYARSVEAHYLVHTGWATSLQASRVTVRQRVQVRVAGQSEIERQRDPFSTTARVPKQAFELLRHGLETGPVLIQTPHRGYVNYLACEACRTPAVCYHCHGPLQIPAAAAPPQCRWCAEVAAGWSCPQCSHRGLRAPILGEQRTAEELGRAFPSVLVRTSSGQHIVRHVDDKPALVIATPGAEPIAAEGYTAVLLLDMWAPLSRASMRVNEEAVRRWMNAAALLRPGGDVLAVGELSHPAVQALVRWDPVGMAERELLERQQTHLPPASRMATVSGQADEVAQMLGKLTLPPSAEVLGPVDLGDEHRYVIRVPRQLGPELSHALKATQAQRAARKAPHLRVQIDPIEVA